MGITKTHIFDTRQNRIARIAKALGHPARIAIIEVLLKKDTCICGDIVNELPLSQSTISQHLKELKDAGVIIGEIEGVRSCYCIDRKVWNEARKFFTEFLKDIPDQENCC